MRSLLFCGGLIAIFLPVVGLNLLAQVPAGEVRASIKTDATVWVGEEVILNLQLLAPGYFASAPKFDFPQVPGVLILAPQGHPVLGSEEINGQSYTVQGYDVLLFAQRPGLHSIPSFKIRFDFKREPLDTTKVSQVVATPEVTFTAQSPPGTAGFGSLISARELTVRDDWKSATQACKVGDAFTRTIMFTAPDVPGMAFPPLPVTKIEGLSIYPQAPVVSDKSDRGALKGERLDTLVYVCQKPGHFVVPAVNYTWWNTDEQKLHTIRLPERSFDVAPSTDFSENAAKTPPGLFDHVSGWEFLKVFAIVLIAAIFLRFIWRNLLKSLVYFLPTRLEQLNPDERAPASFLNDTELKG